MTPPNLMTSSTPRADQWLLRLLVAENLLTAADADAIARGGASSAALESLRRGFLTKQSLAGAVQTQYRIAFAEPDAASLDKLAVSLVPEALCRRHGMVPLKLSGETIELLMSNPLDATALDSVMAVSGRRPTAIFGLPDRVEELIEAAYGSSAVLFDLLSKLPEEEAVTWVGAEQKPDEVVAGDIAAPVIRLANTLIAKALRMKASDIHIEHEDKATVVRFRIDGALQNILRLPKSVGEGPLVSRIKIMADLDVADRRRPQDGRAKLLVGLQEVGLRVSTVPTSYGEKAVLRILDKRHAEVPLEALGLRPELKERLTALSEGDHGMLLVTGPTGSGKTTTLYSILHKLKSEGVNIVTVEDPIEYRLEGINQIQVHEKAGLTFACALRSVLRQDPDIVLVGEIRDRETADIAFQAALTGHLVFSSLHTSDTVSAVSRLLDMGVERFKMAPALIGVAAQRLARRLCVHCRVEAPAEAALARRLAEAGLPEKQYKAAGCDRCGFTGTRGRIALTELLDLSSEAAHEVIAAGRGDLRETALQRGWLLTMTQDALWHLSSGDISVEEAVAHMEAAPPTVPRAQRCAAPRKRSVLIVDDNADNRGVAVAALKAEGYDVAQACGGEEALEAAARGKPDLMLLDLMMPGMDGLQVLKKLRREPGAREAMSVIILTAAAEEESQALALEAGADDYLTKPFNPAILRARVKAALRRLAPSAPDAVL